MDGVTAFRWGVMLGKSGMTALWLLLFLDRLNPLYLCGLVASACMTWLVACLLDFLPMPRGWR